MFLSKLWFVSERIPPFLLFSTLIHEIVQTLVVTSVGGISESRLLLIADGNRWLTADDT